MKKPSVVLSVLCFLLVIASGIQAQEGSGGTQSIFSLGAGSRGIAMGGAFSALCDDPSALYYNPASLRMNTHPGILLNHIQLFSGFSDANYDFMGLVYPTLSVGAVGMGFMTAGTGGIREFDEFSTEKPEEVSYRESQAILAYAVDLPWRYLGELTLGSSIKFLSQRVASFSDNGTGVDIGVLYRPPLLERLVLGCNLQDIVGAEIKLVTEKEKVDQTLMLGAGYSYLFKNGSALGIAVQMDVPKRADNEFRFGLEYSFRQMISFRLGYDSEQITAGFGIMWHGLKFDYGYFSRDEAGSSHPISLSARIGSSVEERIRLREDRRLMEEEMHLQQIFATRIANHIKAAGDYRRGGELEKALDELKIALEYDPANEAAAETLAVVRDEILLMQERRTRSAEKSLLINQHFSLGLKYYSTNEYLLSRAEWRNVLELDPENEQAKEYLSRTDAKLIEQLEQHRTRAIELENGGRLAEALGEWNVVRMLNPGSVEARDASERISRIMEERSRDYSAASKRIEVIELFEDALSAFSGGRYSETIELCNRILRSEPGHKEAARLIRRARRRITPLTAEEKEEIRRLYIEGMKQFSQGNYTAAIKEWRKILDIDPDNESVMKNIEEAEIRLKKIGSPEAD